MKQTTLQFEKPILEILRPLPKTNRKKIMSATYVKYTVELALAKMQQIKQQGR